MGDLQISEEALDHQFQYEVSKYFGDFFTEQWKRNKVPVLVDDNGLSVYFIDRNEKGYPKATEIRSLVFDYSTMLRIINENEEPSNSNIEFYEKSIVIRDPILSTTDYSTPSYLPIVYMWKGYVMMGRQLPIEKLNVKELMKVAQTAIQKREGIIMDKALTNKLIK